MTKQFSLLDSILKNSSHKWVFNNKENMEIATMPKNMGKIKEIVLEWNIMQPLKSTISKATERSEKVVMIC